FTLDAGKFILAFSRLQRGANFFLALRKQTAILRTQARTAAGGAQPLEAIAKRSRRTPRCRGRVVQLVREPGGGLAERSQLFSLLFFPGDVSDAVGQKANEALGKLGHPLKEFRKLSGRKRQGTNRKHGTPGHANGFHSGERQDACYISGTGSKDWAILRAVLAPGPEFTLQDHQHGVRRSAFLDDDSTIFDLAFFRLRLKPFEIGFRLFRVRRYIPQLRLQDILTHFT